MGFIIQEQNLDYFPTLSTFAVSEISFKFLFCVYFDCMYYMCVVSHGCGSQKRVLKFPKTGVTDSHGMPGCLELNKGS